MELIGVYLVGCALLVLAGAMKARRPDDTARALLPLVSGRGHRLVSFQRLRALIRIGASVECGLGVVAFLFPRPATAALVTASYLGFTGAVLFVRSQGGTLSSCGCFGTPDGPATLLHAAIDLSMAIAAVVVTIDSSDKGSLATTLAHQPLHGGALILISAVGVWLTYLTLSVLGRLHALRFARTSNVTR